jgi:hypothetical protein
MMILLAILLMASCSTTNRTRREIKKKCDCRKWGMVNPTTPQPETVIYVS